MTKIRYLLLCLLLFGLITACSITKRPVYDESEINLVTFSKIHRAWQHADGNEVTVAVLDWQFDLKGKEKEKYSDPVSMIPGEPLGELKPGMLNGWLKPSTRLLLWPKLSQYKPGTEDQIV